MSLHAMWRGAVQCRRMGETCCRARVIPPCASGDHAGGTERSTDPLFLCLSFMSDSREDAAGHAVDFRLALIGGVVTALIMAALVVFVGAVGSGKAKHLLEATLPTTRFLCSSVMTASATTLALMLTLLSLSTGIEGKLKAKHYERIRQIAFVDVVAFIAATILLVALIVPFGEDIDVPYGWYATIYYVVTLLSALLGGILVAVMIMLYTAVGDLIGVVRTDGDHPMLASTEREEDVTTAS